MSAASIRARTVILVVLCCSGAVHIAGQAVHAQDDFPSFDTLMNPSGESELPPLPRNDRSSGSDTDEPNFDPDDSNLFERFRSPELAPAETMDFDRFEPVTPLPESGTRRIPTPEPDVPTQSTGFDWRNYRTSVADLTTPAFAAFQHGNAFLTRDEEAAYLLLLKQIDQQRLALIRKSTQNAVLRTVERPDINRPSFSSVAGRAEWETAFYQFAHVRRLAFQNGHLRAPEVPDTIGGLPNPFGQSPSEELAPTQEAPYLQLTDINRYPEHYTGRPVVLYGRFAAESIFKPGADDQSVRRSESAIPGTRDYEDEPAVRLMRGTLTSLTGTSRLAVVDTRELLTPQSGALSPGQWPAEQPSIPVLVKGWVVKQWNDVPLVFCESMRLISPIPHFELIRRSTIDRSRLRDEEKWLYYETLTQLERSKDSAQREVAASVRKQRIDELMLQVRSEVDSQLKALGEELQAGSVTEDEYRRQKRSLERRLQRRVARYTRLGRHPEEFETYVDVFQHPEFWHGHLVSLSGHVRHVMSYPGDEVLFRGRMLHELWLFTDDSQHNPAVIVTPELPADFPTNADVIDSVHVTGCMFKRYVYDAQDSTRIAPLLLAGSIQWTPTVDQVQTLVEAGQLADSTSRAQQAAAIKKGPGRTTVMVLCFMVIFVLMVLWGRAQREERDRVQLRKMVNDAPDFEESLVPGYHMAPPPLDIDGV